MKTMKIKSIAMAGVLSLSMLAGMPVMAATKDTSEVPTITKTVTKADGVTSIDTSNQTVTFSVKQVQNKDGISAPSSIKDSNKTISLTDLNNIPTTAILTDDEVSQLKTGEYTFEITENIPEKPVDDNGFGWTVLDKSTYYLQILVKNDNTKIYQIYQTNGETDPSKKDSASFTNTYNKKGGDLTVTKTVSNPSYVDANQTYPITIEITLPDVVDSAKSQTAVTATVSGKDNAESKTKATVSKDQASTKKVTVSADLKDGEKIIVTNLPVGATYTFSEDTKNLKNFKEVKYSNSGEGKITVNGSNETVTNTFNDVTVTGVVTNIAPYITMVVVAGAAIAVYVVLKKRLAR